MRIGLRKIDRNRNRSPAVVRIGHIRRTSPRPYRIAAVETEECKVRIIGIVVYDDRIQRSKRSKIERSAFGKVRIQNDVSAPFKRHLSRCAPVAYEGVSDFRRLNNRNESAVFGNRNLFVFGRTGFGNFIDADLSCRMKDRRELGIFGEERIVSRKNGSGL